MRYKLKNQGAAATIGVFDKMIRLARQNNGFVRRDQLTPDENIIVDIHRDVGWHCGMMDPSISPYVYYFDLEETPPSDTGSWWLRVLVNLCRQIEAGGHNPHRCLSWDIVAYRYFRCFTHFFEYHYGCVYRDGFYKLK